MKTPDLRLRLLHSVILEIGEKYKSQAELSDSLQVGRSPGKTGERLDRVYMRVAGDLMFSLERRGLVDLVVATPVLCRLTSNGAIAAKMNFSEFKQNWLLYENEETPWKS